jgi:hypothetical protein
MVAEVLMIKQILSTGKKALPVLPCVALCSSTVWNAIVIILVFYIVKNIYHCILTHT